MVGVGKAALGFWEGTGWPVLAHTALFNQDTLQTAPGIETEDKLKKVPKKGL